MKHFHDLIGYRKNAAFVHIHGLAHHIGEPVKIGNKIHYPKVSKSERMSCPRGFCMKHMTVHLWSQLGLFSGAKKRLYSAVDSDARAEQKRQEEEDLKKRLNRNKVRIADEHLKRKEIREGKGKTIDYLKSRYKQSQLERENYKIEGELDPTVKAERKAKAQANRAERAKRYNEKVAKVNHGFQKVQGGFAKFEGFASKAGNATGGFGDVGEFGNVDVNELIGLGGHKAKGKKGKTRDITEELLGGTGVPGEKDLLGSDLKFDY